MLTSDFDYTLPESAIAQQPLRTRDLCKLCVIDRASGLNSHERFLDLPDHLKAGDLLVLNNSKVLRARVPCLKQGSGGGVEVFLLNPPQKPGRHFRVFLKPSKRLKEGSLLKAALGEGAFKVLALQGEGEYAEVEWQGAKALDAQTLESIGVPPLPPYIRRERIPELGERRLDARYYQTLYASKEGSAAAPTAGLHFTQRLVSRLRQKKLRFAELTLHVGAGTFLPVKTERLEEHPMHEEAYEVSEGAWAAVISAKKEGRRVIAVGTTSARVLESAQGPGKGATSLFIKPGFSFQHLRGLITNFHQPKSTLLALVSAFYDREKLLNAYADCLSRRYRFLSYGDAMLLV